MTTTGVAIVGASGYAARELIRILLNHPRVRIAAATSRQDESPRLDALHPSLARRIDLACEPFDAGRIAERASFAFLALPHTASMAVVPDLRRLGVRVIDLSADYRLADPQVYADWYGHAHTDAEGLRSAVYGLPELFREEIPPAGLIANPGCYTSTSILALAPLIAEDLVERNGIIIDAKSGVSGAGRSPKLTYHFPECNESLSAYSVGRHRHTPEIDQVLTEVGGHERPGRAGRGDLHAAPGADGPRHLRHDLRPAQADGRRARPDRALPVVLRRAARSSASSGTCPATKDSAYTNFCDITVRVVRGRILVLACLDNLIKGAAGVAVQNLNLMLGCPEDTALL